MKVGRPHTAATKAGLSARTRRQAADPAWREVLSRKATGRVMDQATRDRISASTKGKAKSVAQRFHMAAGRLGVSPVLMMRVQADLVDLARKHGIDLEMVRRMTRTLALATTECAEEVQPDPSPVVPAAPVVKRPRLCLGCRQPLKVRSRQHRMCYECRTKDVSPYAP